MPDVYANITSADRATQERLVTAMELRAAEPRQREILETYLAWIDWPENARILEVGCGTGAITRVLARRQGAAAIVGVDPSAMFLAKARELAAEHPHVTFRAGDVRALEFGDGDFDAAIAHTCLTHVPGPDQGLRELFRVLEAGGSRAVFDGDYASTTLACGDHDPIQACADAAMAALVHDRWLARRLPTLVKAAGFEIIRFDGHAYVQTIEPGYLLTLVDRGADALANGGTIGRELAEALKAEARRRVDAGGFYGSITFASLIARKPA
ncbi:MAG: methyltransferase domain-containing protein [Geminicoccaceae bacterium]